MSSNFSELKINNELKELIKLNGFEVMTPVQEASISEFLKKDVIVQSQTGSGKTLSYLIPIFNKIQCISQMREDKKEAANDIIQALIIVPTRELCLQISGIVESFKFRNANIIGGSPIEEDVKKLKANIVVGTPGRLFEIVLANRGSFNKIKYLVIDECDKLFGHEFEAKLFKIIEMLPKSRITGLFSATIDDNVNRLSLHCSNNPLVIKVSEHVPEKLSLKYKLLEPRSKIEEIFKIVKNKKCIVFMATCNSVDFFYSLFENARLKALNDKTDESDKALEYRWHKIHGKMDQNDRNEVYTNFEREGGTLICTDVAARGIDFKNIDSVIHFDVPKDYSNIIHRSGRTARNGQSGDSIIFIMENEKAFIDFMKLKGVELDNSDSHKTQDVHANDLPKAAEKFTCDLDVTYDHLKQIMDKDLLDKAVKAFVSYIRSYKEHILSYILNFKELNYDSLTELFFLERIPSMAELKHVKFKNFARPDQPANKNKKNFKKRKLY